MKCTCDFRLAKKGILFKLLLLVYGYTIFADNRVNYRNYADVHGVYDHIVSHAELQATRIAFVILLSSLEAGKI